MRILLDQVEDAVLTSITERRAVPRRGVHVRLPGGHHWRYLLAVFVACDIGLSLLR